MLTYDFFNIINAFQTERNRLNDEHETTIAQLEQFRGSLFFTEQTDKIQKTFEEDNKKLRADAIAKINDVLKRMNEKIEHKPMIPPTEEILRVLQLLKMKKTISESELLEAAECCRANPTALSILQEIALENGILRNVEGFCDTMSSKTADRYLRTMKAGIEDFLESDIPRSARLAERYHNEHFGNNRMDRPIAKRKLLKNRESCFAEIASMDTDTLTKFSEIVDRE